MVNAARALTRLQNWSTVLSMRRVRPIWLRAIYQAWWTDRVAPLCDGLGRMLGAGVPMDTALQCLQVSEPSGIRQAAVVRALHYLHTGEPLSAAWNHHASAFLIALLTASERSGALPAALVDWANQCKSQREQLAALVKSLGYPVFVMVSNFSLLSFVSRRVLPSFVALGASYGSRAPGSNEASWVAWLQRVPWILLACLVCILAWWLVGTWLDSQTNHWARILASRSPGSRLRRLARTAHFCRLLSTMLQAGIAITDALAFLSTTGPRWLRTGSQDVLHRLLSGRRISEAFQDPWGAQLQSMLTWADQTGDIAYAIETAHHVTYEAWFQRLTWFVKLVEPIVLALLGGFILATMAVVFVPMYDQLSALETTYSG